MKFLFFFLGVVYYFIFYLFSQKEELEGFFFENIYLEGYIYIFLVFIFVARLFITQKSKKQWETNELLFTVKDTILPDKREIILSLKIFFSKYIYFWALFLFYVSLFLILQALLGTIDIPKIFLFFNILALILLFIENRFSVFQDILRVNTALVSLYYIGFHILYLSGFVWNFQREDMLNIALLCILFFIFFRSQKRTTYKKVFQTYAMSFIFLEACVFAKYFFWESSFFFWFLSFLFSFIFLAATQTIKNTFFVPLYLVRTWWLIFSYIYLIFFSWQVFQKNDNIFSFLWTLLALITTIFLYLFHKKFWNYFSYIWSIVGIAGIFFFLYNSFFPAKEHIFFIVFSWSLLFFDVLQKSRYPYDTYLSHTISLIVNLFWVFLFFFFIDFSILNLGILLSLESFYLFASYYSLQKRSRIWFSTD